MKYFRVLQDTFLWEKGAIIGTLCQDRKGMDKDAYCSIDQIYDKLDDMAEYISANIVEDEVNSNFFERVYPVNLVTKTVYKLKAEAKELLSKQYN